MVSVKVRKGRTVGGLVLGTAGLVLLASGCLESECPEGLVASGGACVEPGADAGSNARACSDGCQGDAPICNPQTLRCVACLAASDCKDARRPLCQSPAHRCVECLASSDCRDAARPLCDTTTNACVACRTSDDCQDASAPRCDPTSHACVGCESASDCTDAAKPTCDATSHACRACAADADCASLAATPVCDEPTGRCVACTPDTEAARCGANSCDVALRVCTSTVRQSLGRCQPCRAGSECGPGTFCVRPSATPGAKTYCMLDIQSVPGQACAATPGDSASPFAVFRLVYDIDGTTIHGVCAPETTCEAVLDYAANDRRGKGCGSNLDCGDPTLPFDAVCSKTGMSVSHCVMVCDQSPGSCFTGHSCRMDDTAAFDPSTNTQHATCGY